MTARAVLDALLQQRSRLAQEVGSLPDTVSGALTRLKNAFQRVFGERDTASGWTAGLAQAIQAIAVHLDTLIALVGVTVVAAIGRMVGAFASSVLATRAETAAHLAQLRTLEAEAIARVQLAAAALLQARAQGAATASLAASAAQARLQATQASTALTQAVASTSLFARAAGLLRGVLAMLGGPIGVIVTAIGLLGSALYAARDRLIDFGGKTASIGQVATAIWSLIVEKVTALAQAIGALVGANALTWQSIQKTVTRRCPPSVP